MTVATRRSDWLLSRKTSEAGAERMREHPMTARSKRSLKNEYWVTCDTFSQIVYRTVYIPLVKDEGCMRHLIEMLFGNARVLLDKHLG